MTVPPLDVVFVCTGNRFRSPIAEASFRRATADRPVVVRSAGTLRLGSVPALPEAIVEAGLLGLDLADHRATFFEDAPLASADLVVGFERLHLATAVVDGGAARDAAFTLPELVDLLELTGRSDDADEADRARSLVAAAASQRRNLGRPAGRGEIADPLGRRVAEQHATAEQVDALARRLAAQLFA